MNFLKISLPLALAVIVTAAPWSAAPAQSAPAQSAPAQRPPVQRVTVTIDGMGYHPAMLQVKAGQSVHLIFVSKAESCANEVVFPSLGKKLNLKVGQKREIVFTPKKGQTLNYICAMKMVQGHVIAR